MSASSSSNLLDRQHDLQPLRLNSDSSAEDNSSVEDYGEDVSVLKEQGYFAQFEQEQKINIEVLQAICLGRVQCDVFKAISNL